MTIWYLYPINKYKFSCWTSLSNFVRVLFVLTNVTFILKMNTGKVKIGIKSQCSLMFFKSVSRKKKSILYFFCKYISNKKIYFYLWFSIFKSIFSTILYQGIFFSVVDFNQVGVISGWLPGVATRMDSNPKFQIRNGLQPKRLQPKLFNRVNTFRVVTLNFNRVK